MDVDEPAGRGDDDSSSPSSSSSSSSPKSRALTLGFAAMPTTTSGILISAFVVLLGVAFVLVRAFAGPTVYDRILAVNLIVLTAAAPLGALYLWRVFRFRFIDCLAAAWIAAFIPHFVEIQPRLFWLGLIHAFGF